MAQYVRTDFSGGLFEGRSAGEFTERQSAILKGFVLESETELRSQWACQNVATPDAGIQKLYAITSDRGQILLGITSLGNLMWCNAPSATATQNTCSQVSWQAVATANNPSGVTYNQLQSYLTDAKFICEVPWGANVSRYASGVLIQPASYANPAMVVYLNDLNVPVLDIVTSRYPTGAVTNGTYVAATGVLPWSRVGTMWGDYLVLGDVMGTANSKPAEFSATNKKRYSNGIWISATPNRLTDQFRADQFDPRIGFFTVGSPESRIVAMTPIDSGLLIYTTSAAQGDGLILLRGAGPGLLSDGSTVTFTLEPVRGGLAAAPATSYERVLAPWPEAGSTVVLEQRGSVWTTNGSQTLQLDRYGPHASAATSAADGIAVLGQYVVLNRGGRLFALRLFGSDGAWTELVGPNWSSSISQLVTVGECLYFVVDGVQLFRFAPRVSAERGLVAGSSAVLQFGSATITPSEYDTTLWHRTGVVYSGPGDVTEVKTKAGPALSSGLVEYAVLVSSDLGDRAEIVVPSGIGRSAEASVLAKFSGDVKVESVYVETIGRRPRR